MGFINGKGRDTVEVVFARVGEVSVLKRRARASTFDCACWVLVVIYRVATIFVIELSAIQRTKVIALTKYGRLVDEQVIRIIRFIAWRRGQSLFHSKLGIIYVEVLSYIDIFRYLVARTRRFYQIRKATCTLV